MTQAREILEKYGNGRYGHMFELDRLYPEIEMFGEQCVSAEVRFGWKELLIPVLEVLKKHGCKVGQIKQKFCELCVYWNYPDHIESAMVEWRAGDPKYYRDEFGEWKHDPPPPMAEERKAISDEIVPVIAHASAISLRTCEECGADLGRKIGPKAGHLKCNWSRPSACIDCGRADEH